MRKTLVLVSLVLVGCNAKSPAAPEEIVATAVKMPVALVHNLPVSDEQNTIWRVCSTQPRQYCGVRCTWEIDYYLQREECPETPID